MTPETAQLRYEKIIRWAFDEGAVHVLPDEQERRKNPRIKLPPGLFQAQESVARDLVDISLGGFAFFASRAHVPGERVTLNLGGTVGTSASVLDCTTAGDAAPGPELAYRVRCKFHDEDQALMLLTMALQVSGVIPPEVWDSDGAAPG